MSELKTYGVVLAAGAGVRFGGPKAPYVYNGKRLIDRAVMTLKEGGCDQVIAVLGAWVGEVPLADVIVVNPDWSEGLSTSLAIALKELFNSSVDRCCITLVDMPGLTPIAVARVLNTEGELIQATYAGKPSHPVVIARDHWAPLLAQLEGDSGARKYLISQGAKVVNIAIDDVADGKDLDFQPT